jgi:ATP-dependent DNA ligase
MTTPIKPMKLTDVGPDITPYLGEYWILQQKHDGARMLVYLIDGVITFTNSSGSAMSFSAAKLRLPALAAELLSKAADLDVEGLMLDGELIIEDGVYHVFDVLFADIRGQCRVLGNERWGYRDAILRGALAGLEGELIKFAVTASTKNEKLALWNSINEAGVEGAVSKHVDSLYEAGTRSKQWVKHKLVKTADVVVVDVKRIFDHKGMVTHGSAELAIPIDPIDDPEPFINAKGKRSARGPGMVEGRTLLPIGSSSLIGKELSIEAGSVVECNYLYWTGSAMIQPRIVRERFDKRRDECDLKQFPEYTRKVITV